MLQSRKSTLLNPGPRTPSQAPSFPSHGSTEFSHPNSTIILQPVTWLSYLYNKMVSLLTVRVSLILAITITRAIIPLLLGDQRLARNILPITAHENAL